MLDIGPLKKPLSYHATGIHVHYGKKLRPTQQMAALPPGHHESNTYRGVKMMQAERMRERNNQWLQKLNRVRHAAACQKHSERWVIILYILIVAKIVITSALRKRIDLLKERQPTGYRFIK